MVRVVKDPAVRRQEIVEAARQLFMEKSYEATSMQDVMSILDIAKGTIYHYFSSKEELLQAVVEQIIEEDCQRKQTILENTPGSALEKVRVLLTAGSAADNNEAILDQLHQASNVAMHTRLLAEAISKQAPIYADIIRQGCEEGVFHTEYPLECAEFMLSAVQFLTDIGITPWPPQDLQRRVLAFPALIEAQLKAPPNSFDFIIDQL